MKYLVLKAFRVLEVHDDYGDAWGALVFLHASSIATVTSEVAEKAKAKGLLLPLGVQRLRS